MSTKIIVLAILYFFVVRYMMNREKHQEVDDIYNTKKKGNRSESDKSRGSAYNKSVNESGSNTGSTSSSSSPGPLSRNGF